MPFENPLKGGDGVKLSSSLLGFGLLTIGIL